MKRLSDLEALSDPLGEYDIAFKEAKKRAYGIAK